MRAPTWLNVVRMALPGGVVFIIVCFFGEAKNSRRLGDFASFPECYDMCFFFDPRAEPQVHLSINDESISMQSSLLLCAVVA